MQQTARPPGCRFQLNRVKLPPYAGDPLFKTGSTDFPTDLLLKVTHPDLAKKSKSVFHFYTRFVLNNVQQSEMMKAIKFEGRTPMEAVCGWLRNKNWAEAWKKEWLPTDEFSCPLGQFVVESGETKRCADCAAGYYSASFDPSTACDACQPGLYAPKAKSLQCRSCEFALCPAQNPISMSQPATGLQRPT